MTFFVCVFAQSYLENNYGDNNKSACQPNISLLKGLVIMFRSVLVVPWLGPSLFGSFCSRGSVARSLAVRFSTFRTFSNLSYLLQPFIPPPTFHTLVAPSGEGRRSASSGCFTVSERPSQGGAGALGAWPVVSGALRVEGQRL